jgi:dienelactone hydrolase
MSQKRRHYSNSLSQAPIILQGCQVHFGGARCAGHAFENPNNKLGYREAAAKDAWARTLAFLNRTLKGE